MLQGGLRRGEADHDIAIINQSFKTFSEFHSEIFKTDQWPHILAHGLMPLSLNSPGKLQVTITFRQRGNPAAHLPYCARNYYSCHINPSFNDTPGYESSLCSTPSFDSSSI